MVRLLGIITVILSLVLFPPAALALISNNAVPGDSTYPVKLGLENGILFFASFNPTTKAWFARAKSDRRYQEVEVLLSQGKSASPVLEELVIQAEKAATDINQVENSQQKQQLISQLSDSISKYNQGLEKAAQQFPAAATSVSAEPTPIPTITVPSASPTIKPNVVNSISTTPSPTIMPTPTISPTPVAVSTPAPIINPPSDEAEQIQKARERLEQIKQRLEQERDQMKSKDMKKEENKINKDKSEKDDERKGLEDKKGSSQSTN